MGVSGRHAFYLVYREYSRGARLSFNIGGSGEGFEAVSVEGKTAKEVFPRLVSLLARAGGVYPEEVTDTHRVYVVRDDLGPLVGAFVLMLRGSRNHEKIKSLEKLINGELPIAYALQRFFEITMELIAVWGVQSGESGELKALDIMAPTLRCFVEQAERVWADGR